MLASRRSAFARKIEFCFILISCTISFQELFEVFDDKKELRLNHDLYIAVLCTYTWSLFQFAFVRTATAETVADHDPFHETKKEVKNMRRRSVRIALY